MNNRNDNLTRKQKIYLFRRSMLMGLLCGIAAAPALLGGYDFGVADGRFWICLGILASGGAVAFGLILGCVRLNHSDQRDFT